MKVLVVGSGGREHAIIWCLKQSKQVEKLFCAPGNAGIAADAECVDINVDQLEKLADFAVENAIDLTVVGRKNLLILLSKTLLTLPWSVLRLRSATAS